MEIYIGNLPDHVKSAELKKVIKTVLLPSSFSELVRRITHKKNRITYSAFDVIENRDGDRTTWFAHAVIMPDQAARQLLDRMNHLTFQGKSLRVREYTDRDIANDRRHRKSQNLYAVEIYNRRFCDRRLALKLQEAISQ